MKIDIDYLNKILGLDLKKNFKKYLERMGFGVKGNKVLVPSYRADILHQIDLIEDIAIAYGYENFQAIIPKVATIGEEDKFEIFKKKISELLIGLGCIETNSYHLIDKKIQTSMMNSNIDTIEIIDPISSEYNSLRAWMIPSLMCILKGNKHQEYPQNIFEIGTVFKKSAATETLTEENDRLCILMCDAESSFTKIKQVLDYIASSLDLKYEIEEAEHNSFIEGRTGRVIINGRKVAYIGEVSPFVLENFEIDAPVAALELNLTELFDIINE